MPTVEGLTKIATLQKADLDQTQQLSRVDAAKQASDLFKQGDIKGALGAMAAVDPDHVAGYIKQYQDSDPSTQQSLLGAQTSGQQNALNAAGNGAGQIAKIGADARIAAAEAKAKVAEDQLLKVSRADGTTGYVSKKDLKQGNGDNQFVPGGQTTKEIDSTGSEVQIGPRQDKELLKLTNAFNKDAKPFVESINATADSAKLLDENIPGAQIAEKLKTIKGLIQTGRVPQQFVEAYGNGSAAGLATQVQSAITQAEGGGLGKQARQNMYELNNALNKAALQEYDSLLKSRAQQAGDNLKVDPFIAKKRFASEGPTSYQQTLQQVQKLPPEAQAAFNFVHDNLASADAATAAKVKAVQKILVDKYGMK